MIQPITIESLIQINEILTHQPCTEERKGKVKGCLSSYFYYETPEEQVTSIVVSLIKGHFFLDGNKRTALSAYLDLAENNNLPLLVNKNALGELFIEIASTHKSISEYSQLLFPNQ